MVGFRVVPPYKVGLSGDGGQLGGVEWVPPIKWGRVPPPPAYKKGFTLPHLQKCRKMSI